MWLGFTTGSPSSLYEPHKKHNMALNYRGLHAIFPRYPWSLLKVKILNKNGNKPTERSTDQDPGRTVTKRKAAEDAKARIEIIAGHELELN